MAGQTARDEANPYGWLPYLVLPNNAGGAQFWGEGDLDDLMDICRQLNHAGERPGGHPRPGGWPITVLENVDSAEGITVGPGRALGAARGREGVSAEPAQGWRRRAARRLHRRAAHRAARPGRRPRGPRSGRQGAPSPGPHCRWNCSPWCRRSSASGAGWNRFTAAATRCCWTSMERFGGAPVGGLRRTVQVWPPILPNDREADARIGVQLVNAGVALAPLGGGGPGRRGPRRGDGAHCGRGHGNWPNGRRT